MRIGRVGIAGAERPVVRAEERTYDLRVLTDEIDAGFLASGGLARVREALDAGTLPETTVADERIGAPLAGRSTVIGIGMNYAAHAAESGAEPPEVPIVFFKPPNTLAGPNDHVTIPKSSKKTDWEVELGVVIGQPAEYLSSPESAAEHIAGYVLANDLSEREFQLEISGGQWGKGKAAPGFTPIGPWLVTPDEVEPSALALRSWVNDEPRQDSTTVDMIFGVDFLVWHLSQYMRLEPGDIVLTGTPEGVALSGRFPYLCPGDVVSLEIDGLGRQRQELVGYGEAS